MIEIGKCYRFAYPWEFVTLPEYSAHRGAIVTVVRELRDGEEYDREDGPPMYEVRAADGWVGSAHDGELAVDPLIDGGPI